MGKFTINDWIAIQTRKDITYIRRNLEHNSINYAIFADMFIAVLSFVLDHVFWTVTDSDTGKIEQVAPSWYWIVIAILLFMVPLIIVFIGRFRRRRFLFDIKMVKPVEYLINVFDNEICYNIMTADTMRDHLLDGNNTLREDIQKFYYIEAAYYVNKASHQLFEFKNQGINSIQTESSFDGIPYIRFLNVSEIIHNTYNMLITFARSRSEYTNIIKDSANYIKEFNDLMEYMGKKIPELKELENRRIEADWLLK